MRIEKVSHPHLPWWNGLWWWGGGWRMAGEGGKGCEEKGKGEGEENKHCPAFLSATPLIYESKWTSINFYFAVIIFSDKISMKC